MIRVQNKNCRVWLVFLMVFIFKPGFCVKDTLFSPAYAPYSFDDRDLTEDAGYPSVRMMYLDSYARNAPEYLIDRKLSMLVHYLTKPAQTELEKVRVLFTWVATHLEYDVGALKNKRYETSSVMAIVLNKTAICGGYACVLDTLCRIAGLESFKISGLSKSEQSASSGIYRGHAWNVVKADGIWRLMDVTWASGGVQEKQGKMFISNRFEPYWFDVEPEEFIFRHFPDSPKWQLLGDTVLNRATFQKLPFLPTEFFRAGFNSDEVFQTALRGEITDFVKVFGVKYPVKIIEAPLYKNLSRNVPVTFTIASDVAEEIWLLDDYGDKPFEKHGKVFSMHYLPKGGAVRICPRLASQKNCNAILDYAVTE